MSKLFLCGIFWLFAYQHYHTIKLLIVFYNLILQIGSKCNTAITYRLFSGYSIFNTLVDKECENIFFGNRKVRTHYQHYLSYIIHKRDNLNWCWRVHVQDGDFRRGHCRHDAGGDVGYGFIFIGHLLICPCPLTMFQRPYP